MHKQQLNLMARQLSIESAFDQGSESKEKVEFCKDLCRTLVENGIPLIKLRQPSCRAFLEKYTRFKCPSETIIRSFVDKESAIDLEEMRSTLKNEHIWVCVDETTNACGRYVVIILAGTLKKESYSRPYFLVCEQLEEVNHTTISQVCTILQIIFYLK